MNWERTIERYPEVQQDQGTAPDPFDYLRRQAVGEGLPHSELEYNTHMSLDLDGKWVKCSVTLRIACPQTERHIDVAGEVAFMKTYELMSDGLSHMTGGRQE